MKSAEEWFSEYESSHRNPVNKQIHYVCVPLILWSVLAALWTLPTPSALNEHFSWAYVFVFFASMFYLRLGIRYFFVMLGVSFFTLLIDQYFDRFGVPLLWTAAGVFVLAWIGQFYGHVLEGQRPSFCKDLQFLLIGPLWIAMKAGLTD